MSGHAVEEADEARHRPDGERLWNESYYCDFVQDDGSFGGWFRLGLYPNLGVAWWTAWIVRPGQPGLCSVDYHMPVPSGAGLSTSSAQADVAIDVRRPLGEFRLGVPRMAARRLSRPEDAYGEAPGEPVDAALDLTWTTDGVAYHYDATTRYEIPATVSGTVTVAGETLTVDGHGQRDHSWGVRDWWAFGWCWSSMRLDDGTRVHLADIRMLPGVPVFFGYVQNPPSEWHPLSALTVTEDLGPHGFPTSGRIDLAAAPAHDLGLDVTPVAFGPVLLRNDEDGRTSRFPRAMVRCRTDDGRTGTGWIEWNQPQVSPG
jgi:hypothetical protein